MSARTNLRSLWLRQRDRLLTIGLALVLVVVTLVVRNALAPSFGARPLLILFVVPIIVSAYAGGVTGGLVATAAAAVLVDYFAIPPVGSLRIGASHDLAQWLALITSGVLISLVTGALHRRTRELRARLVELKSTVQQLREAQKLESIGRLAGGVAHDFNNILSVILGYSALCHDQLPPEDPMRADLDEITQAAGRAAALTRQLLAFSRKQVLAPRNVDLGDVVAGMGTMLRRLIGEDIELSIQRAPDLGTVRVDVSQIEQVLLNLAVNARDAMPNGGKLTIETANVRLDAAYQRQHPEVAPGPYLMIAVSDNGVGMDRATQERMFEPFFTTKEVGKGTGLGLSTTFGIVKQSGGSIWVYSELGRGTTFKIYLPQVDAAKDRAPAASVDATRTGTETILLVEDDRQVRGLACGILRRAGYQVIESGSGQDALEWLSRHDGPLHLLLTDVVMPRMSGRDLAERVAQVRPDAKLLFMSGYTDNAIVHHGILDEGVHFLQKPFTPESLTRKVQGILRPSPVPPRLP